MDLPSTWHGPGNRAPLLAVRSNIAVTCALSPAPTHGAVPLENRIRLVTCGFSVRQAARVYSLMCVTNAERSWM